MNDEANVPVYSIWPLFLALGVLLIAIGIVTVIPISIIGMLLILTSLIGWVWQNRTEGAEAEVDNE